MPACSCSSDIWKFVKIKFTMQSSSWIADTCVAEPQNISSAASTVTISGNLGTEGKEKGRKAERYVGRERRDGERDTGV